MRAALGYETKAYHGVSGFVQFEGVFGLGQDLYRSADNGLTTRPLVADTPTVELNQAYGQYVCPKDPWKTQLRWGRQEINLGNQRLVGAVAWRQDTQTFDGGGVTSTPWSDGGNSLMVGYNYLYRVNRIFPDESLANPFQGRLDMDSHLAQALLKLDGLGQLHLYGLLLDYDDRYAAAVTNLSSSTIGARASGAYKATAELAVLYGLEFARQSDFGSNLNTYDADYLQAELGAALSGITLRYGYSVMSGDGATDKFTTPLATLHAFDGWVDLFLNTPNTGLETHQLTLSYVPPMLKGLTLSVIGYIFNAESTGDHFGNELDLLAEYRVASFPGLMVGGKFGYFDGDDIAGILAPHAGADQVSKLWVYTQYAF